MMTTKQLKRVMVLIEEARNHAYLRTASLGVIAPRYGDAVDEDAPLPTSEDQVTKFIQRRCRLHHNTWIIGPLQEALDMLRKEFGP